MRHLRGRHTLTLAIIGLSLATAPAHAAWTSSPNLGTPIATTANDEGASQLLADGQGGAFISFIELDSPNYIPRIQRIDRDGTPLWTSGGVKVTSIPSFAVVTQLVSDGAGGVIAVFADDRNDPGVSYDVLAQRFDAAGTPLWTADGVVVASAAGNQVPTGAIEDGAGGVIISWDDERAGEPNSDIYAQRLSSSGASLWTTNGVPISTALNRQARSACTTDGAGGAIMVWEDERGADIDVYAQRVNGSGTVQWTVNGVPVVDATGIQTHVYITSDAAGGAYVTWTDYRFSSTSRLFVHHITAAGLEVWASDGIQIGPDLSGGDPTHIIPDGAGGCLLAWVDYRGSNPDAYVQRLDASGTELWNAGGLVVGGAAQPQYEPKLLADGDGGALVFWSDERVGGGSSDLYGQHVNSSGSILWATNGSPVCTAAGEQYAEQVVDDDRGGAIVSWSDRRTGVGPDVYAQRVEPFGHLGAPEPAIQSVNDVTGDQGGAVRVAWSRSYLDVIPGGPADEYRLWREVPTTSALAALERGARLVAAGAPLPAEGVDGRRILRASALGGAIYYWELEAVQPAGGFPAYSKVARTGGDSSPPTYLYTRFMVEARESPTGYHWDSYPDSGYSIDDLAPPAPSPFTGNFDSGTSSLSWGPSAAPDVSQYYLYRGGSESFVPGPGNRVATVTGTSVSDAAGALFWYKVTAVDVHGNEGPPAVTLPSGTVAVESDVPDAIWLGPASPNPACGPATFRLALPAPATVTLTVFDQQGRRVRALTDRAYPAGRHEIRWDGLSEGGRRLGSGVYLYRMKASGVERTGTVVIVH
jgi:FlgD Ig-like domain